MKIHIVQKGDTLWELSQKYDVDFEELKQVNSHLSSPDMIMPGMKIKIPSSTKTVKKEHVQETKKKPATPPYKDISVKPMPVIQEDDKKKKKVVKPEMPVKPLPQMQHKMPEIPKPPKPEHKKPEKPKHQPPKMKQEFQNYTTINFPHIPDESSSEESMESKEISKKEYAKDHHYHAPKHQPFYQPIPQFIPVYYPMMHPCPPMPHHPVPGMFDGGIHEFQGMPVMMDQHQIPKKDCGCGGKTFHEPYQPMEQNMYHTQPAPQQPTLSTQGMPVNPMFEQPYASANSGYPAPPAYPDFANFPYREQDEEDLGSE